MSAALNKLEDQLTCAVCLSLYTAPRSLPCHHIFCQDCLLACIRESRQRTYVLFCPICRAETQLPDGGVAALPIAFSINSLFELHQEMKSRQEIMECSYHKKALEAFCESCQMLVCFTCTTRSHGGHRVQQVSDLIDTCNQELEEGTQRVKRQITAVTATIRDLASCKEAIAHRKEAIEKQIRAQAIEVKAAVDQAERELMQEVETAAQQKMAVISVQIEEAQKELKRLQDSIKFVEKHMKVQPEPKIVASKATMLEHMDSAIRRARESKLKPMESVDLRYVRNRRAIEECRKFGTLHYSHISQKCQLFLEPLVPGRKSSCLLSVEASDDSRSPLCMSQISCLLTAGNGPRHIDCTVTEQGPGAFEIGCTPVLRTPHSLRVTVGGVNIPGSVFAVPVLPPSPETRGQLLHSIQGLRMPHYIAVGSRGHLVVSETGADCIRIFDKDLQQSVSVGTRGKGLNHFSGPAGVAITDDDYILVADRNNHRIQVLTMDGQFVKSVGSKGSGHLEFESPTSIVVHPSGQVLVSERNSNRIQVLNHDLSFCSSFVVRSSFQGPRAGHYDMAVDRRGVVYVTDPHNCCILKFLVSGEFVEQFGSRGYKQGELALPCGIAIDQQDHVYISETTIQRISVFTSSGNFVRCFEAHCKDESSGSAERNAPGLWGLASDKNGNLYASSTKNGQVVIF